MGRGIAVLYRGARLGSVVNATPWPLYPWERGKRPGTHCAGGRVAPVGLGAGVDGCSKSCPQPQTLQSVVSSYTIYTILPYHTFFSWNMFCSLCLKALILNGLSFSHIYHTCSQWKEILSTCVSIQHTLTVGSGALSYHFSH